MQATQPAMSDLEERLAGPDGAAVRWQVIQQLRELETRLDARMARLVPKEEFASLTASLEAVRACQSTLGKWMIATAPTSMRSL